MLETLISSFEDLQNKEIFLEVLCATSDYHEKIKAIGSKFKAVNGKSRVQLLDLMLKLRLDEAIRVALKHFISTPDDSNAELFEKCKSMDADTRQILSESATTALASSPTKWSNKETQVFLWVTLAPEEFTDLSLRDSIELALDRGTKNDDNDIVKETCADIILRLWEQGHGFSEKSYNILKKLAPDQFRNRIAILEESRSISGMFMEKVTDES